MPDSITHRGPDDEEVFISDIKGGFGNRRLAIIDLSPKASNNDFDSGLDQL